MMCNCRGHSLTHNPPKGPLHLRAQTPQTPLQPVAASILASHGALASHSRARPGTSCFGILASGASGFHQHRPLLDVLHSRHLRTCSSPEKSFFAPHIDSIVSCRRSSLCDTDIDGSAPPHSLSQDCRDPAAYGLPNFPPSKSVCLAGFPPAIIHQANICDIHLYLRHVELAYSHGDTLRMLDCAEC
jgi:hypothetical protein